MTTDFLELCAKLADQLEVGMTADGTCPQLLQIQIAGTLSEAVLQAYPSELLALLRGLDDGRPAPKPPSDGEVAVLLAELLALCNPAPVPVSEGPPGPKDCDGEGRCWWLKERANPEHDLLMPTWHLQRQGPAGTSFFRFTHWLPAHALPLPAGEVQP